MVLVPKSKKEPKLHHKKRYGHHRKHTQPYSRPYAPYLPLLMIAGLGMLVNVIWNNPLVGQVLGAQNTITAASDLLNDTNQERRRNNEPQLSINTELNQAAQAKAADMARQNYWSHTSPDGTQPWNFIEKSGYSYRIAGENLAYGFNNSDDVIKGWMNSAEHRANLLNGNFREVGFGVVRAAHFQGDKPQTIIVALYGAPAETATDISRTTIPVNSDRQLTRLEVIAGNSIPGSLWMLITVTAFAAGLFLARHLRFAHRALAYSEAYIVRHRHLDVLIITVVVAGLILSRGAGFIR